MSALSFSIDQFFVVFSVSVLDGSCGEQTHMENANPYTDSAENPLQNELFVSATALFVQLEIRKRSRYLLLTSMKICNFFLTSDIFSLE